MKTTIFPKSGQSGAALITVLLLLVVVTIIGLASLRGTFLQEKMSGSSYDRNISMQQAESALRAGETYIRTKWQAGVPKTAGYNCETAGVVCDLTPANTFTNSTASGNALGTWVDVASSTEANVGGPPQYYIEYMATADTQDVGNLSGNANANAAQYGGAGGKVYGYYFRVTARGCDPSVCVGRAVAVVQSTVEIK